MKVFIVRRVKSVLITLTYWWLPTQICSEFPESTKHRSELGHKQTRPQASWLNTHHR